MMEMAVPPDNTAEPGRGTVPGRLDDWFARREPVIFIALLVALRLSAIPAGWWSRPNRTRPRPTP